MATAVIPSATALLRARRRDDGSVELHHVPGRDPPGRHPKPFTITVVEVQPPFARKL